MRLLLDAHLSPRLARSLRGAGLDAESIQEWRGGDLLEQADLVILAVAAEDQRILVSADQRSIPNVLRLLVAQGQVHAGVIFIRDGDAARGRIGSVTRRLLALRDELEGVAWTGRIAFLAPHREPPPP